MEIFLIEGYDSGCGDHYVVHPAHATKAGAIRHCLKIAEKHNDKQAAQFSRWIPENPDLDWSMLEEFFYTEFSLSNEIYCLICGTESLKVITMEIQE